MNIEDVFVATGIGFLIFLIGDLLQITQRAGSALLIATIGYFVILCWCGLVVIAEGIPPGAVALGAVALGAVVTACNVARITIEDVIFPRIFVDYNEYKKRVPFLVPCRKGA